MDVARVAADDPASPVCGPVLPPGEVSVAAVRCGRPVDATPVVYPGTPGDRLLLLQRRGAFVLRSRRHDLVVDATVCLFGHSGEDAVVAHPYGCGDLGTFVALSPSLAETVVDGRRGSAVVKVTGEIAWLHQQILRRLREPDRFAIEECAIRTFAAAHPDAATGPTATAATPPAARAAARRRQRNAVEHARGLLAADPTIDSVVTLAWQVGCSPHHLCRIFKDHAGMTVSSYRRQLRTHTALELLTTDDAPLAQVAARSGFADHAHMTRTMRRFTGHSPSEMRRSRTNVQDAYAPHSHTR